MSKSHVRELQQVYRCLFEDIAYAYPALGAELSKDLSRLDSAVAARGLYCFTVDLPAVGKHLDRCLSDGQFLPSGLPLTKRCSGKVAIPQFLRGLYQLIFDSDGCLKEAPDEQAIFFLRQVYLVAKKYSIACAPECTLGEVREFYRTDAALPNPEGFWSCEHESYGQVAGTYEGFSRSDLYVPRVRNQPSGLLAASGFLLALDFVSGVITSTLGPYDPSEWKFRHGPGAIAEVTGPTNKFAWRNWSERLESVYPIADCGFHNYSSWAGGRDRDELVGSQEPSSRLIAVPKTYTKPRLIAAEPSEHQWCQQNSWHYFCCRCKETWIDDFVRFRDQSLNQSLCLEGSRSGSIVTVDLSAASDRVTCHAVGQMFRSNPKLLYALRASRTRSVTQSLALDVPETVLLKKFSTMGSANTFPVESLIFLAVSLAAVVAKRQMPLTVEGIRSLAGQVSVFGDDIIIPADSRILLFEALEVLDFKVNVSKSYWNGKFRESCGVDAFAGVNLTPVYVRRFCNGSPDSVASVADTRNNLYNRWLLRTAAHMASTVEGRLPFVPIGSGVTGLVSRTPVSILNYPLRINTELQRGEVLVGTLSGSSARIATNDDSSLLQYFTERPEPIAKWVHGITMRPRLRTKKRWVPVEELR